MTNEQTSKHEKQPFVICASRELQYFYLLTPIQILAFYFCPPINVCSQLILYMYNYRVFLVCKGLFSLLFPPNKKCFVVLCRRLCVQTFSCLVAELSFMSEIANYFDHLTRFDATIWRVLKCKTGRDKSRCTVGEISGGGK